MNSAKNVLMALNPKETKKFSSIDFCKIMPITCLPTQLIKKLLKKQLNWLQLDDRCNARLTSMVQCK